MSSDTQFVRPRADVDNRSKTGYTGWNWIQSLSLGLDGASSCKYLQVDLSNLHYIGMYELVSCVALLERHMRYNAALREIGFDFAGNQPDTIVTKKELVRARKNQAPELNARIITVDMLERARQLERLQAFVESLGTAGALEGSPTVIGRDFRISYPFLGSGYGEPFKYSVASSTVISGISRVDGADDCAELLSGAAIQNWKNNMGEDKFEDVPYFATNELWRTFFFEFAVNIIEHAHISGFICGRVIPLDSYAQRRIGIWPQCDGGAVELCICDAGEGIANTLSAKYLDYYKREGTVSERVSFAFHSKGTSKSDSERHLHSRHALARLMRVAQKYGGIMRFRTGDCQVDYDCSRPAVADNSVPLPVVSLGRAKIHGTHIQFVLPLHPAPPKGRRNWMTVTLPTGSVIEPRHPKGNLIPVEDCLSEGSSMSRRSTCASPEEFRQFADDCRRLVAKYVYLTQRPAGEPFVFDFSGLHDWSWIQLKVFFGHVQRLTDGRPVLAVELDESLIREVREHEIARDVMCLREEGRLDVGQMGAMVDTDALVLALSWRGRCDVGILGLVGVERLEEEAMLSLCAEAQTIDTLLATYPKLKRSTLESILGPNNPLFEDAGSGKWQCVWTTDALETESCRVVTRHFQTVALRSLAWRGCPSKYTAMPLHIREQYTDHEEDVFKLPWRPEDWVDVFLECGRIFAREREVDEIAQRLIRRLLGFLQRSGIPHSEVHMFAVTTAPSLMLATAMHRWWPWDQRPKVLDLGHQMLQEPDRDLPMLGIENAVILQDVLDDGGVTHSILRRLRNSNVSVLCVLAFVRFVDDKDLQRVITAYGNHDEGSGLKDWCAIPPTEEWDAGWTILKDVPPAHGMLFVRKPSRLQDVRQLPSERKFWVEPRCLRPYSYAQLRGGASKQVKSTWSSLIYQSEGKEECFLKCGHFAYGLRHYGLTVDLRSIFQSSLGDQLATQVADICCGLQRTERLREAEDSLRVMPDDVTLVLMPLHSQVHYLWRKVSGVLAARGRRQTSMLLDATLFLGHGPSYQLPLQFSVHLRNASRAAGLGPNNKMRILILDDAMISGRTLETILADIDKTIDRVLGPETKRGGTGIDWIKVFVPINTMPEARWRHWSDLRQCGTRAIPFKVDQYLRLSGLPAFESSACPHCRRLAAVLALARRCSGDTEDTWKRDGQRKTMAFDIENVCNNETSDFPHDVLTEPAHRNSWPTIPLDVSVLRMWIRELTPKAIDSGIDQEQTPRAENMEALPLRLGADATEGTHFPEVKLWHFIQQMYRSFPLEDVLAECMQQIDFEKNPKRNALDTLARRYYRTFVYDWCFDNFARVRGLAVGSLLLDCLKGELSIGSTCSARMFLGYAAHPKDPLTEQAVGWAMGQVAVISDSSKGSSPKMEDATVLYGLLSGIAVYVESAKALGCDATPRVHPPDSTGLADDLTWFDFASHLASKHGSYTRALLWMSRIHIYWQVPGDALRDLAEQLFRGRDLGAVIESSHLNLPRLVDDYYSVSKYSPLRLSLRLMLQTSLTAVINALRHLSSLAPLPYADAAVPRLQCILRDLGQSATNIPSDYDFLHVFVDLRQVYCLELRQRFHFCVLTFIMELQAIAQREGVKVDSLTTETEMQKTHLLAPFTDLMFKAHNWGVNAAKEQARTSGREPRFGIEMVQDEDPRFVIIKLYQESTLSASEAHLSLSKNFESEKIQLQRFFISVQLSEVVGGAETHGFHSALGITIPKGLFKERA